MSKKLPVLEAISILVGTTIGAGILGIPYVIAQAGFLTGMVVLIILSGSILMLNLFLGEIVLSTENKYQLTGYAHKYLGNTGKYLMLFSTIAGFYGALLAYIIGEGRVIAALAGGSAFIYSLLFFCFGAILVYLGLIIIKKFEFVMTLLVLAIVVIISLWSFHVINLENLALFDWQKLFIPYGVIFFAVGGASAVPQLRFVLKGKEKAVKKSIIIGVLIPFAVYLIFTLVVVGVSGLATTEIATIGLGKMVGEVMIIFGNLFAFFTMATSFLTLGLALKETYFYDLNLNHIPSWLLACLPPLILFILGLNSFVKVIGIVGAIGGGIEGLLILAIFYKVKTLKNTERKPEYKMQFFGLGLAFLALIFLGGLLFTIWNL